MKASGFSKWVKACVFFRAAVLGLAVLGLAATVQAQSVAFAIGEWAPYTGQKLSESGLATEIVTAACKAVGLTPSYDFVPWRRAEANVLNNAHFATFPFLRTSEREKNLRFSDVIFTSGLRVLLAKNSEIAGKLKFNTPADLKGMTVLIVAGSDAVKTMLEQAGALVVESQRIELGLKMLDANRVDAIVEDQVVLFRALSSLSEEMQALFVYAEKFFGAKTEYRLMSSLTYPNGKVLLEQFNAGLARIRDSGELTSIQKSYGL